MRYGEQAPAQRAPLHDAGANKETKTVPAAKHRVGSARVLQASDHGRETARRANPVKAHDHSNVGDDRERSLEVEGDKKRNVKGDRVARGLAGSSEGEAI